MQASYYIYIIIQTLLTKVHDKWKTKFDTMQTQGFQHLPRDVANVNVLKDNV